MKEGEKVEMITYAKVEIVNVDMNEMENCRQTVMNYGIKKCSGIKLGS